MTSKREEIIKYITKNIYLGKFPEKHTVPSEGKLSIRFNCSRLTARVALRALTEAGYLDVKKGTGYTVSSYKNHTDFKNLFQRFNADSSVVKSVLNPSEIPLPDDLVKHADLLDKFFDIDNCFAFEKQYLKKGQVIIYQLTFFNKRIISNVSEQDINPSIFKFLYDNNIQSKKAKEWLVPTSDKYFYTFAKKVGWIQKPFPIMLSTLQTDEDWVEFTVRVVSPKELRFSKIRKLY